jgi:hypothetical protein
MVPTPRRFIALILGFCFAFAPIMVAGPAMAMAHQVAVAGDAGSADCDCCPKAQPNSNICATMCLNVLPIGAISERDNIGPAGVRNERIADRRLTLTESDRAPDPPPPRPRLLP